MAVSGDAEKPVREWLGGLTGGAALGEEVFDGVEFALYLFGDGTNLADEALEEEDLVVVGIGDEAIAIGLDVLQPYGHDNAKVLEVIDEVPGVGHS